MKFNVLDIFAGCGGLSEGFRCAGFSIVAQVEKDQWACQTLRSRNLYWKLKETGKNGLYKSYLRDEMSWSELLKRCPQIKQSISVTVINAEFGGGKIDRIVDRIEVARKFHNSQKFHLIIGGPPCQAYSLAGRGRDPDRMETDGRHYLYEYYLKILQNFRPDFFVFENVPGLISANPRGINIFARLLSDFGSLSPSYHVAPGFGEYLEDPKQYILDSHNYGVPQSRRRIILLGYKSSLGRRHPSIAEAFRKIIKARKFECSGHTVSDAIGDLPFLKPCQGQDGWLGEYEDDAVTPFQHKMRTGSQGVINQRARSHMQSDLDRYRFFIEHHLNGNRRATIIDLIEEKPELTPAHKHLDKFIDRFKVQWWARPSSTITAHISKYGHYYIHPDIHQCRSFTVREAARCQSFPDNFKFEGPRTSQFRQVGNAVPPLLSYAIAKQIMKELKHIYDK